MAAMRTKGRVTSLAGARFLAGAALWGLLATGVAAQEGWLSMTGDTGGFRSAIAVYLSREIPQVLAVECGEPLPGRPVPAGSEMIPPRGMMSVRADGRLFGGFRDAPLVGVIEIDGSGFPATFLPDPEWEAFRTEVAIDAPVIAAMRSGSRLVMKGPSATEQPVSLKGSSAKIAAVTDFCRTNFPLDGEGAVTPRAAPTQVAVTPGGNTYVATASAAASPLPFAGDGGKAHAAEVCASRGLGAPTISEGFVREVSIDGDGAPDYVVDWSAVTCGGPGGIGAGDCGALGCGFDVWISASGQMEEPTATLQGYAVQVRNLGDGHGEVALVGNGQLCRAPETDYRCVARMGWDGVGLVPLAKPTPLGTP